MLSKRRQIGDNHVCHAVAVEVEVLEVRGAYKVQRRKFVVTGIEVLSAVQSVTDKLSRWLLWQLSVSRVDEDWRSRATSRFDAMLRLLRAGTSDISNSVRRLLFTAIFTRVGQSVKSTSVSLLRDTFTSVSMGSPLNVTAASLLRDTSTFARALKPERSSVPASFLSFHLISVTWLPTTVIPSHVDGSLRFVIFRASALVPSFSAG